MAKFYRSRENKIIAGVCGGIAEHAKKEGYDSIDANLLRMVMVILGFLGGFGILLYFCVWVIFPKMPKE